MTWLSARRNDSSTAFLIHWCVIHWPPDFSATRSLPESSRSMTLLTAARRAFVGLSAARPSQASSTIFCSLSMTCFRPWLQGTCKVHHALGRFHAVLERRHERNAQAVLPGVAAACFAAEEAARQDEHVAFRVQATRELAI